MLHFFEAEMQIEFLSFEWSMWTYAVLWMDYSVQRTENWVIAYIAYLEERPILELLQIINRSFFPWILSPSHVCYGFKRINVIVELL